MSQASRIATLRYTKEKDLQKLVAYAVVMVFFNAKAARECRRCGKLRLEDTRGKRLPLPKYRKSLKAFSVWFKHPWKDFMSKVNRQEKKEGGIMVSYFLNEFAKEVLNVATDTEFCNALKDKWRNEQAATAEKLQTSDISTFIEYDVEKVRMKSMSNDGLRETSVDRFLRKGRERRKETQELFLSVRMQLTERYSESKFQAIRESLNNLFKFVRESPVKKKPFLLQFEK